ncbi:MAG: hypothetical protein CL566_07920 [Alphaproteobacteria bacterium]|nr:hypothetical protein [Alphaproteobacteria bacterium]|tara:strand:+ start:1591 stop:1968 length:378 start_codon:yes stop_codon:yes gene_type:complete
MTRVMNRAALLLITTLTGLGALYSIYLDLIGPDGMAAWQIVRGLVAIVVAGTMFVTWNGVLRPGANDTQILKCTALLVLAIGVVGLAANALIGGRTSDPDGRVFVLSLLLILQALLTIAYAARRT